MKSTLNKLSNPIFILCVVLLLLNDFYLKITFHNIVTGKLSDFVGLYAFAFLFGALFYKYKLVVHWIVGGLFVLWKSPLIQPIIDWSNEVGLAIGRTVDYTDYVALVVLVLSYVVLSDKGTIDIPPRRIAVVLVVSAFAFIATTMPPQELREFVDINKEYKFKISKKELVSRMNDLWIRKVAKINTSGEKIHYHSGLHRFSTAGVDDTLAWVLDEENLVVNDTIMFETSYAVLQITGDDERSSIKVLNLYKSMPMSKSGYRRRIIKEFKRYVVKEIRAMGKEN